MYIFSKVLPSFNVINMIMIIMIMIMITIIIIMSWAS